MSEICLYGASGHGKVIYGMLKKEGKNVSCFIDDNEQIKLIDSLPVYPSDKLKNFLNNEFILSIGNNKTRKEISSKFELRFTTVIDPSSIVSNFANIDKGSVVMPGAIINTETKIGKHCIINTKALVEHDCEIRDFVHISPNATITGNVTIKEGAFIGAGAVVLPNVVIGKWSVIGAGAVVIDDVPDNVTVVGNPGRVIKKNNRE